MYGKRLFCVPEKSVLREAPRCRSLLWSSTLRRRGNAYLSITDSNHIQFIIANQRSSRCDVQVVYDVRGTLEKNRDTFRDDVLNMLRESRCSPTDGCSIIVIHSFTCVVVYFTLYLEFQKIYSLGTTSVPKCVFLKNIKTSPTIRFFSQEFSTWCPSGWILCTTFLNTC